MASIQQTLTAGTDISGTITAGDTSQLVAAANLTRKALDFQNISDTVMWITETLGAAAADTSGCWAVSPGDVWAAGTNRAIYVICATTGKNFTALEV